MAIISNKDHVLTIFPISLLVLRSIQLATAVAVLGLASYGENYASFDGDGLILFTVCSFPFPSPLQPISTNIYTKAIATIIITVYIIVSSTATPVAYNYWAILGLDIFAIVFWVIAFPLLASEVAGFDPVSVNVAPISGCYFYGYNLCYKSKRGVVKRDLNLFTYRNAMAAAAGLGGLEL
jgi:hypothetical protein